MYTLWLTFFVYSNMFGILEQTVVTLDIAALTAAILGPVSLLLGFVTKIYAQNPYCETVHLEENDKETLRMILKEHPEFPALKKLL